MAAYSAVAVSLAMLTPIVRTAEWVNRLPIWFQWHLRPAGDHTTFTVLPWAGFVFAGAAVGVLIAAPRDERAARWLHAGLGLGGAAITVLGLYAASLPSIYRQSSFWTSSPTYFAIRVGILMLALTTVFAIAEIAAAREPVISPVGAAGTRIAVCLLGARRNRLRLRDLAVETASACVADAPRFCPFQPVHVRGPPPS